MLENSGHATMPKFEINTRRLINGSLSFLALAAIIALFFAYRSHAQHLIPHNVPVSIQHLPYYAFCSFYRMLAAYIIALIFSIIYGMAAARGGLYERILIPAIDIAQSVPVVGFFPAAVYFFVALAHGSRLGVEMAAVFLIFTSQAWNMALGVFEAVRTIPIDSIEALDAFGPVRAGDFLLHRTQPGELALGELARGRHAARFERGRRRISLERFPRLAIADGAHRGQAHIERVTPAQFPQLPNLRQPTIVRS